jgi:formylglycine-generating enzyme required for sulfatase activity
MTKRRNTAGTGMALMALLASVTAQGQPRPCSRECDRSARDGNGGCCPGTGPGSQPPPPAVPPPPPPPAVAVNPGPVVPPPVPWPTRRTAPAPQEQWVAIPAGDFQMGSPPGVGRDDEHPQHRMHVNAFEMHRTEVTVAAYQECVTAGRCTPADRGGACNAGVAGRANHPINCVDWSQARAYCEFRGGRLPTEPEWEYAARGTDGRTYPWRSGAPLNQLCWSGVRGRSSTCPVGAFPSGVSPFGLFDMAGNVWEWTATEYLAYSTAPGGYGGTSLQNNTRVLRGGGWDGVGAAVFRAVDRGGLGVTYRIDSLGFRCARG